MMLGRKDRKPRQIDRPLTVRIRKYHPLKIVGQMQMDTQRQACGVTRPLEVSDLGLPKATLVPR